MKTILIYGLIKIILFIIAIPVSFKIERKILIEKDQEIIKLKKLLKEAVEEKQRTNALNQGLHKDIDILCKKIGRKIENQQDLNELSSRKIENQQGLKELSSRGIKNQRDLRELSSRIELNKFYEIIQNLKIENQHTNKTQNQQVSEDVHLNNIRSCCQSSDALQNTTDLQNELMRDCLHTQIMDTQSTINAGISNLYASTYPGYPIYPYMDTKITNLYTKYPAHPQMMPPELKIAAAILHTPYGR